MSTPTAAGDETARRHLAELTQRLARPVLLGCSTVAHRDLGFCQGCVEQPGQELIGWRLLALAERGHVS